jgi:hypothetical protein
MSSRRDASEKGSAVKPTNLFSVPPERIEGLIAFIRGQKVMLDSDLATLYDVPTKALLQAVRRNTDRFPEDFMFQLTKQESDPLRSQIVTSEGRGGRRYLPYAFTEQGVAMLSSVLRSKRAIQVNIEIMRAFVRMRQMIGSHAALAHRLEALEKKYDRRFRIVFDAIRELMLPPHPGRRAIGFRAQEKDKNCQSNRSRFSDDPCTWPITQSTSSLSTLSALPAPSPS